MSANSIFVSQTRPYLQAPQNLTIIFYLHNVDTSVFARIVSLFALGQIWLAHSRHFKYVSGFNTQVSVPDIAQ